MSVADPSVRWLVGERNTIFLGRCALCGHPARRNLLCHACSWAYGTEEYTRGRPESRGGNHRGGRRQETE